MDYCTVMNTEYSNDNTSTTHMSKIEWTQSGLIVQIFDWHMNGLGMDLYYYTPFVKG